MRGRRVTSWVLVIAGVMTIASCNRWYKRAVVITGSSTAVGYGLGSLIGCGKDHMGECHATRNWTLGGAGFGVSGWLLFEMIIWISTRHVEHGYASGLGGGGGGTEGGGSEAGDERGYEHDPPPTDVYVPPPVNDDAFYRVADLPVTTLEPAVLNVGPGRNFKETVWAGTASTDAAACGASRSSGYDALWRVCPCYGGECITEFKIYSQPCECQRRESGALRSCRVTVQAVCVPHPDQAQMAAPIRQWSFGHGTGTQDGIGFAMTNAATKALDPRYCQSPMKGAGTQSLGCQCEAGSCSCYALGYCDLTP